MDTRKNKAPFRYDVVGSFLRPDALKKARKQFLEGRMAREELTLVEDEAIIKLIAQQKAVGLKAVTDGEFRRRWWHLDFIASLKGISVIELGDVLTFNNTMMERAQTYYVSDALAFNPQHPFLEHFRFVSKHAGEDVLAKQTIPGPNMIYSSGMLQSTAYKKDPVYTDFASFAADIGKLYQDAIQAFYDAGCRYLQLDDTAWGALMSPAVTKGLEAAGYDINQLIDEFTALTVVALENKPEDMVVTFHMCRGNFKSSWLYEGTYDKIASKLFSVEKLDGFFLEYDDERSGDYF